MTKVLIVDDSAVIRSVFAQQLARDPTIEVVGSAPDPYVARDMIVRLEPDVITLDIEMPRMDGLTFLRKLMHYHPMPVVIVSSLTPRGGELAVEALASGAIEVICKPNSAHSAGALGQELITAVKRAAGVKVIKTPTPQSRPERAQVHSPLIQTTNKVLALGASTGGTTALEIILQGLPHDLPGTVVTQHMPKAFTRSFADRLARTTGLGVKEAEDGDSVVPGVVLIAPGDQHMVLRRSGARYYVQLKQGPRVSGHCPSVDVLFRSVAKTAGANAVAALCTGMGKDGAQGLLELKQAGAYTLAQDERSCVVFGMPKAAIDLGAVDRVVPLTNIASAVLQRLREQTGTTRTEKLANA